MLPWRERHSSPNAAFSAVVAGNAELVFARDRAFIADAALEIPSVAAPIHVLSDAS
jgi:hypothetical protein